MAAPPEASAERGGSFKGMAPVADRQPGGDDVGALTGLLGLAQEEEAAARARSPWQPSQPPGDMDEAVVAKSGGVWRKRGLSPVAGSATMDAASGGASGASPSRNSPDSKGRLERNRTAAQQCRKRKKEYVKRIEEEVTELRAENWRLRTTAATAATENELLRRENEMYRQIVQSRGGLAQPALPPGGSAVAAANTQLVSQSQAQRSGGGGGGWAHQGSAGIGADAEEAARLQKRQQQDGAGAAGPGPPIAPPGNGDNYREGSGDGRAAGPSV